jgi:tetratricopeptide (TPR) repeat protein
VTVRRAAVALAAVCLCLGAGAAVSAKTKKHHHHTHRPHGQHAAGGVAEGRAHLKRANALAGEGDCAAAIEEYTKAYDLLDDPVVLFNRGECYRRTNDAENAVDDYREFLEKVPTAPNRADVEAKIVALEAPEAPSRPSAPPSRPSAPPVQPPPPKTAEAAASPKTVDTRPPAPEPESRPAPAAVVLSPAASVPDAGPGGGTRPWVWITLAVLVAAAAAGSYLMFRPRDEPPPTTALGNYRF